MTAFVTPAATSVTDDGPAMAELHRLRARQRQAFLADPYPAAAARKARLSAAGEMVMSHRDDIRAAMSADFGSHPELFTDLVEVLGVAARAAYAAEQLDAWLAADERPADPAFCGSATAAIRYQPKGVIGNIVPWNFPFDLSVGPLVEMLAAGHRVIIKPSDYTPACGELLRRMVAETFGEDLVAVSVGGPPASLRIMREEVFGPILPVIPYDDLAGALAGSNAGERPLGLYVYSQDTEVAEQVLQQTTSGGTCVNVCAVQGALPSLGFGGVGQSGTGRHHGIEGFREFSNPRGVVVRGTGDLADAFLPPYGPTVQAIVDSVFGGALAAEADAQAAEAMEDGA